MNQPTYSFVVPIYNEEENIFEMYSRLTKLMDSLDFESELILVDDGSYDSSLDLIRQLHLGDSRVRYLSLARNFGHQIALTAGLNFAQGRAVIIMDADLQDPPELVPELIACWRQGYKVVYAQRVSRQQESWFKRFCAYWFYRVLRWLSDVDIPMDTGDFCLMDRQVVDLLNSMPERSRYIRGLRSWVGFPQTSVEFHRPPRFAGEVKYTFLKSLSLAISSFIGFSTIPLRLATYLGIFSAGTALLMVVLVLYWRFVEHSSSLIGVATLAIAALLFGAVQLICVGILGEYIGRIYDEVKSRPLFTIKEIS